jgi:LPS-assembly protein
LTLALTSRTLDGDSGAELLRASIGQILYFDDREVTLPGEPASDDSSSALVAEIDAALRGGWRSRAGLEWDPHDGDAGTIDQALAQINYRDKRRDRVFNAAYRLRDGVISQTDLAALWPIDESLSLIGRYNYSLQDDRLLEALAGLEYRRCCWRIRAIARQYVNGAGDDDNLAFLLQLELNGLGRLGDDIDGALERGIYGYRDDAID